MSAAIYLDFPGRLCSFSIFKTPIMLPVTPGRDTACRVSTKVIIDTYASRLNGGYLSVTSRKA